MAMEPQHPEAGGSGGSEQPPLPLLALQAAAAAVDSLTGAVLPIAEPPALEAAGGPSLVATASEAAPANSGDASAPDGHADAATPGAAAAAATPAEAPTPAGSQAAAAGALRLAANATPVPFSPWPGPLPHEEEIPSVLAIAGRRYAVADLPADAQELFAAIRLDDALLAQKGETCQLLRWGLDALTRELGQQLQAVQPLPALLAGPDPRLPWGGDA